MNMINAGRQLVEDLFPDEIAKFAHSVCDGSDAIYNLPILPASSDVGRTLATKLQQIIPVSSGTLQKVLISMYCIAPHSMQAERVVSCYNTICCDKRLPIDSATANHRLQIALNGKGTAHFYPRPCVAKFLDQKERRYREPDEAMY